MKLVLRRPDWNFQAPKAEKESLLFPIHKNLHDELAKSLREIWPKFANGCEHLALLAEEIVDNRFLHNDNTRNLHLDLELLDTGEGTFHIAYDGVAYHDLEAAQHSAVVEGIVRRLCADYKTNNEYAVEGEKQILSESPKTHATIKFKLKD
jgi:hypothetical protein